MTRQKSIVRLILEPIAVAIVLALIVRHTFVRLYAIPSASMSPTLQVGDHILVTPFRAPFLDDRPMRGQVVVFRMPGNPEELLVKRVIATPGDVVESRGGRLIVGGYAVAEPYILEQAVTGTISKQIVPADCYFVMGDNRMNSYDSRNWGVLPRDLVVGRARLVLWSSGDGSSQPSAHASTTVGARAQPIDRVSSFDRLFKPIE